MNIISWITAGISVALLVLIFYKRGSFFLSKYKTAVVWWYALGLVGITLLYTSWSQYRAWELGAPGLLPPHTSIGYFISYVGFRMWAPYVVSLGFAFLWWMGMKFLNKKYEGKFFYDDEICMAPLALFLVGYPGVLLYILLFFFVFVVGSLVQTARGGMQARMSMRFFWIPLALCVILINELYFSHLSFWGLLKI